MNHLRLGSLGVSGAVPAVWRSLRADWEAAHFLDIAHPPFSLMATPLQVSRYREHFDGSLLGVYTEDAFLATIPLLCLSATPECFVSVYNDEHCFRIGVVVNRQLMVVYRFAPAHVERLPHFLAQLERWLTRLQPGFTMPRTLYLFNMDSVTLEGWRTLPAELAGIDNADLTALQAAGVALLGVEQSVPPFAAASPRSAFRATRALIMRGVGVVVAGALLFGLAMEGATLLRSSQAIALRQHYDAIVRSDADVEKIRASNQALAESILRISASMSQRTNWTPLLEAMGKQRPKGLFFERLGSEPLADSSGNIRLALTGWADGHLTITAFIEKLQKLDFISAISLTSIEQDKNNSSITRFKVLCTIHCSNE
jgi:Tfp pilus assembly protein PilN